MSVVVTVVMMATATTATITATVTTFPMLSGRTSLSTLHPDALALLSTIIMKLLSFSLLLLLPLLNQTRNLFFQLTQTHFTFSRNSTINLFPTITIP